MGVGPHQGALGTWYSERSNSFAQAATESLKIKKTHVLDRQDHLQSVTGLPISVRYA
jgi:hypothetical protein